MTTLDRRPDETHVVGVTNDGMVHDLHPYRNVHGQSISLCGSTRHLVYAPMHLVLIRYKYLDNQTTKLCRKCWIAKTQIDNTPTASRVSTNQNRDLEIVGRARSGMETYEQIGEAYGLTRERVRQVAAAGGVRRRDKVPQG